MPGCEWSEDAPRRAGVDGAALREVTRLVRAHGAAAQLCVLRDGQVVLDRQFGCAADALFLVYSVSKPFVALLMHLLAEQGRLGLDDPVAEHWPAYARYGKEPVTIRHVLAHRAGVPFASGTMTGDAVSMTSWDWAVRQAERARPRWPAGQVVGYHMVTYGFILGELVRRLTGTPVAERLACDLLRPLGLRDIHLGLPAGLWSRHVPVAARGAVPRARTAVWNRRRTRQAVIPAAGISATARDLAVFYQMLLDGGRRDGVRVLQPGTIAEATRPSSDGQIDRVLGRPVRYGHGFALGRPGQDNPMGRMASRSAFGHAGSNLCLAWADPVSGLVVAYLTNRVTGRHEGRRHLSEVSDAILAACR